MREIAEFLWCATPTAWVETALEQQALLLVDHANCEKKAASTALNLMYRHVENFDLLNKMSRLAREELRHFEQVIALMRRRGIVYAQLSASRYASRLRAPMRSSDPGKLIDTLIIGAIIEARSCERFAVLAPHLDDELGNFYRSLLKSESRHFQDYLHLAHKARGDGSGEREGERLEDRVQMFLALERELIESEDSEFRFHSGVYGR